MEMNDSLVADLENKCRCIIEGGKEIFSWSWDDRFMKALSTFQRTDEEIVYSLLESSFFDCWTYKKAKKAPQIIKDIINSAGGMEKDQLIFATDPEEEIILVCNWWPWGNGETISLRIGMFSLCAAISQMTADEKIKEWFGVS